MVPFFFTISYLKLKVEVEHGMSFRLADDNVKVSAGVFLEIYSF